MSILIDVVFPLSMALVFFVIPFALFLRRPTGS